MPKTRPTLIRVRRRPGETTRGILSVGNLTFPCILGRSGITRFKREGDGATPAGRMALLGLYRRADRHLPPPTRLPVRIARADDVWIDDPADGRYNRPGRGPCRVSHETLRRDDRLYDVVVVLDWNVRRRITGHGSAIFFHLTRTDGGPTAGCVAVAPDHMARILARVGRHAVMVVD